MHPNIVDLFYGTIASDSLLKENFSGLRIGKNMSRRVMARTVQGGPGNAMVVISKQGANPFEWNSGGRAGQQQQTIRIDVAAKMLEATEAQANGPSPPPTAYDVVEAIKRRLQDLLFSVTYNGTGWINHHEQTDGYPSAPLASMAYDKLIYQVWITSG